MSKKSLSTDALPDSVRQSLKELGERIRAARLRRRMTQADLAAAMYVSRRTLQNLEAGDPGTGLGVFATALFALGMHGQLATLVAREADATGLWHVERELPRRAHKRKQEAARLDF